jgi:hypothetical protein
LNALKIAQNRNIVRFWLPPLIVGCIAWAVFLIIGETPLIRATGLALTISGIALALRRMGAILAIIGSLTLAFSPAFWSQTGGAQSLSPKIIVLAILIAILLGLGIIQFLKRPYVALGISLLSFAAIYWTQIDAPRSLRFTGLLTAWLLYLLVETIRVSNPRPDETSDTPVSPQQITGILILLLIGVINDPLFVLLVPAVGMGLWLSHIAPGWQYWAGLIFVTFVGLAGISSTYISAEYWRTSALMAHDNNLVGTFIVADGWREGIRWTNMIGLVIDQVTVLGAILSVFGLARMTRWYPKLGIVLMIAYAGYFIFGLMYFGNNREILLIPLFTIQIIWLTYAIDTFGQWLMNSPTPRNIQLRWLISALYIVLPVYLLLNSATGT